MILGSVDGWDNHDAGYDLECDARIILAEIKNKWNTMNSSNRRQSKMIWKLRFGKNVVPGPLVWY